MIEEIKKKILNSWFICQKIFKKLRIKKIIWEKNFNILVKRDDECTYFCYKCFFLFN